MPPRILAIDDSLTIRKLLEMVLRKAGFDLEIAATGQDGVARAMRSPPDLILLDYVLPDMKGLEVCSRLAKDENLRGVPIVLMSAKSEDVKSLFMDIKQVVDFIGKPFTPPEIVFVVQKVLGSFSTKPASSEAAPLSEAAKSRATERSVQLPNFGPKEKEAAARTIYSKMRDKFAKIPAWYPQLAAEAPEVFFARKILTPDLMDAMLMGLAPILSVAAPPPAESAPVLQAQAVLSGQTSLLPLMSLLKILSGCGRTGFLRLEHSSRRTEIYLRRGELLLATHNEPHEYARQSAAALDVVSPLEKEHAYVEQRRSLKPFYVSLAEAGRISAGELPDLLYEQGKSAILDAIEAGPMIFSWHDLKALPDYVEAYGRVCALEQLALERLRQIDDWNQVELHVNSLDATYQRSENFSRNLKRFELNDSERCVLTLVDKRNTVKQIIERSGATTFEVFHILFRLSQVNLIRQKDQAAGRGSTAGDAADVQLHARPVLIVEPDVAGVQQPLAKLLRRRNPIQMFNANEERNLMERIHKERPRLVILNVNAPGVDAEKTAREIRATLEISDMPLAAFLDTESPGQAEHLRAAGFSAVLVKPVLFEDLEPLIA